MSVIAYSQKENEFIRELEQLFSKYQVLFEDKVLNQEESKVCIVGQRINIRIEDLGLWQF